VQSQLVHTRRRDTFSVRSEARATQLGS